MKYLKVFIILSVLFMFIGCDPLYSIYFANNSNKSIVVNYYSSYYPDTIILDYCDTPPIESQDTGRIYETIGTLPDFFRPYDVLLDTVSVFVYDADTVNYYSWDTVVKYNLILQRYDISMSDLEELEKNRHSSILFFPPTVDMKHIHMWPPYGTYDENEQKKNFQIIP